jgi:poly(3-hydroxybutyrate) depolymerase
MGGTTGSGSGGNTGGNTGATGGTTGGGIGTPGTKSAGCGKTPALKNSTTAATQNTISVGGTSRQYIIHWPDTYKNDTPYRLVIDYHGATGSDTAHFSDGYMGIFALAGGTTICAALSAVGGIWDSTKDLAFTDAVLKEIEDNLCIDTSRIMLEGFSQGAAMVRVLGCERPGVFRAIAAHSAGGLGMPSTCKPIPYFGSLGTTESGNGQNTQTDPFAKWNGCTIESFPTASKGSHVCSAYKGCPAADPVTWCSFDGGHGYQPKDSGASTTWMPKAVWDFFSPF